MFLAHPLGEARPPRPQSSLASWEKPQAAPAAISDPASSSPWTVYFDRMPRLKNPGLLSEAPGGLPHTFTPHCSQMPDGFWPPGS